MTGRRHPEVLCVGETMLLVTPEDSRPLSSGSTCLLRAGGAESNVAAHLARLGHAAMWAGRLGDDPLGRIVFDQLAASGIDLRRVDRDATAPTGVYFKNPGDAGTSVHYYRRGSAASRMGPGFLDALADLTPRVVHLTGITPALSTTAADLVTHALRDRPFGEAVMSFDVNHRPALWSGGAPRRLLSLARAADVVFVGLDEAGALWDVASSDEVRDLLGPPVVLVVKDGARAATVFEGDRSWSVPALPVDVVEPVGAGDAFAAGWLSGFLRDLPHPDRLTLGHRLAAAVLRSPSDGIEL